jgi:hypothetical protein
MGAEQRIIEPLYYLAIDRAAQHSSNLEHLASIR